MNNMKLRENIIKKLTELGWDEDLKNSILELVDASYLQGVRDENIRIARFVLEDPENTGGETNGKQ
jgi:hypothetical protein